jgi:conjugal transfer mating pair stabilization protein TraG
MRSSKSSSGSAKSSFEQVGETLNKLDQITKSVADSTGLTQTQVATIAFGASAQLGFNNRVAGGKLSARADKSYLSGLSAQEQKVLGSMSSNLATAFLETKASAAGSPTIPSRPETCHLDCRQRHHALRGLKPA